MSTATFPTVPDRVIVKLRPGVRFDRGMRGILQTGRASLDGLLAAQEVRVAKPVFARSRSLPATTGLDRIYRLDLPSGSDVAALVVALSANANVEYAEPDYVARAAATPNDPLLPGQWGLDKIEAPAAWDVVTGTQTVVIAIVDSGIDKTHPDLSGKLWVNPGEIPGNGIDDDNNGYIDDVNGWDFVNNDNDPSDDNGHGTQAAGVAAAATDNGTGIAGVCWGCRVMPVKVMQISGVANYSDIAAGVLYAAQKGAKVINLSLGGYSDSATLRAAIQVAVQDYGAVVVGGAGNDNLSTPFYPAAYSEVLAVAGTTITDTKAAFSDYGTWVDVSAPAVAITTTFLGGDWGPVNGTSYAAPFVSGLAGLLRSQYPDWSESLIRAQIDHTTDAIDDHNPGYTGMLGSGRVNAATAVTRAPHPILALASTAVNGESQGHPTPGESATLEVALVNDWLDATGVIGTLTTTDPYVTIGQGTSSFGDIPAGATGTGSSVYTFAVGSGAGYNYPIPFTLAAVANGGAYTTTIPLTITTRSGDEPFCGTIAEDMTWTNDKTYIINCNVGIAPGCTLTVQPGTDVRFNGNYALNVGGTLIADGTPEQPIRFLSHTGEDWGQINFDDSSTDARVDADYDYLDGSVLRYVQVEDTAGIACNSATPYLAHVDLRGGVGIDCTPGTLMVGTLALPGTAIVLDSQIASELVPGGVIVNGAARLMGNTVTGDSLVDISGQAMVMTNTVNGSVSVGSGSLVQNNAVRSLSISGLGTVMGNNVTGGGINFSLSAGESEQLVLSNTVKGGGISVGLLAQVHGNDIQNASGWGISGSGIVTATRNRLVGNRYGIKVDGGLVQGNLIANSSGTGLEINGNTAVVSNTFTGNRGSTIKLASWPTSVQITGNNLEGNIGSYDIENQVPKTTLMMVSAQYNWWGTTSSAAIAQRIFDFNDDYNIGQVLYAPVATAPIQTAPAYVRAITLTPESPVGIQAVAFDVEFSQEMNTGKNTKIKFVTTQSGSWENYNKSSSDLCGDYIRHIAADLNENIWFATYDGGLCKRSLDGAWTNYGYSAEHIFADESGGVWIATHGSGAVYTSSDGTITTYNTSNSDIPFDTVSFVGKDHYGNIWFGGGGEDHTGDGAAKLSVDGSWTTYSRSTTPLEDVMAIFVDAQDRVWFTTRFSGVIVLSPDGSWTIYNTSNSILLSNYVSGTMDRNGNLWFTCYSGSSGGGQPGVTKVSPAGIWSNYTTENSPLNPEVRRVSEDSNGNIWFGYGGGVSVLLPDGTWEVYQDPSNPGLMDVHGIAFTDEGKVWIGSYWGGAVTVLYRGIGYAVTRDSCWLSPTHYRATYDINALVPRDTYSITVWNARGTDGIEIAPNSVYTFTIDYTGAIGDTTPPSAPTVLACGATSPDTLSARWSASDPDGTITLYRYAIGTTPGGTDVVNWTDTTETSFLRTGLSLTAGQTYYVAVKARNAGGLWSEDGVSNGVVAGSGTCPGANFTANPTSGPASLNVQFTDISTGTVDTWFWDFGDEVTSTLQNPSHIYDAAGVYTVSLLVTGPGGSDLLVKPNYITVTEAVSQPVPDFTASPLAGQPPLTVVFTDTSIGPIDSWLWDFGGGVTSTEQYPTHTYTLTGTFTVSLTVSGPGGSDTEVKADYIQVSENPVIANFTADPTGGSAPLNVQFTDESAGTITSWLWDFGDDATSTRQHPTHTYTTKGIYTVTLTVSGPGGSDDEVKTDYITVYELVSAAFTASPRQGTAPLEVTFTNQSTGDYTASLWDFGDELTSTQDSPTHTYTVAGVYTVSLTASGPGGTDSISRTNYITVTEPPPAAGFTATPLAGQPPLTVVFTDTSTGAITGWLWKFGDGEISTAQHPTHTYTFTGTFTVSLTVTGPGGDDTEVKVGYVRVSEEPVIANFTAYPTSGSAPLTVQFTDASAGEITSWLWDFGDTVTSTAQHPAHIYETAGVYTVSLYINGPGGSDDVTKPRYITVTSQHRVYLPVVLRN